MLTALGLGSSHVANQAFVSLEEILEGQLFPCVSNGIDLRMPSLDNSGSC